MINCGGILASAITRWNLSSLPHLPTQNDDFTFHLPFFCANLLKYLKWWQAKRMRSLLRSIPYCCSIVILFRQITMFIKDCVAFVLGMGAFNQFILVKAIDWRPSPIRIFPKQSPHNLLWMLWFDRKVYLVTALPRDHLSGLSSSHGFTHPTFASTTAI